MEQEELRSVDVSKLDRGYESQEELVGDLCAWLDLLLYAYYTRHQWVGPSSELKNMLGLVVSREEFEHNLAKATQRGLARRLTEEEKRQLALSRRAIELRLERTERELPLLQLFERFELDAFAQSCVVLAYAPVADRKYEKIFAYLQDDMTRKQPGTDLAIQLFLPEGGCVEEYQARFFQPGGFLRLFDPEQLGQGKLMLREVAVQFLTSGSIPDHPGLTVFDGGKRRPRAPLVVQGKMARQLDGIMSAPDACRLMLSGGPGSGKRLQVEHLMARHRARCVFADLSGENWQEAAQEAALAADLLDAYLCLYHLERQDESGELVAPGPGMMNALERLELRREKRFFLSQLPIKGGGEELSVEIALPPLTEQERLELFRDGLKDVAVGDRTVEELASKFRFSPSQIHRACSQAVGLSRLTEEGEDLNRLIHQCCYRQVMHKLGDLASKVPAAYSWEDVVLPQAQKKLMKQACAHIQYQHQVYWRWGFEKKVSYGRGLSILFAGAPGTGKTMCAQVIANQLDMELYKINLSQIVSKYIGETEKNLRAVFTEAKDASCILFFDECDALFGKRSEVKDSHDRNANVEVAYLLQQIEEYDGVCILATNLIGNIDDAFMRRITYVVHFPFPEAAMREAIYRRMIPAKAPVSEEIDWRFLAEKFQLSGGHIKNIVLEAAFLAAGENCPIAMKHLLRAAVNQLKKNGIVVVREQLQEYADLLDE